MDRPRRAVTLAAEAASPGAARRFCLAVLDDWALGAAADTAALLVSELVTNAVLHARSPLELVLAREGARLRVEVHDGNPALPARKHYSDLAATGRGLAMVELLATDWGVTGRPDGKRVWFELDLIDAGLAAVGPASKGR